MIIKTKIFTSLRHYVPDSVQKLGGNRLAVSKGTTVAQVLETLNIPEEEIKLLLVNGHNADSEQILNEGDVLYVFPPIAGG